MKKIVIHGLWEHTAWLRALMSVLAVLPANTWTSFRVFGIIALVSALDYGPYLVGLIFTLILLTDFIDGKVARLDKQYSLKCLDPFWYLMRLRLIDWSQWRKVGIWYDPMADKIFIISYLYYFGTVISDNLPIWLLWSLAIIEMSGRIIIIPIARSLLNKAIILPANFWGKAKFVSEAVLAILIFLAYYIQSIDFSIVILAVGLIALLLAVFSILNYIFDFHDPWRKR